MSRGASGPIISREPGELLRAATAGDREAFGESLGRARPSLRASVAGHLWTRDRPDWVEDVCQEAITKLLGIIRGSDFRKLARVPEHPEAYLDRVARNAVCDRFRAGRRKASVRKIEADNFERQADHPREHHLNREQAEASIAPLPPTSQPYFRLRFPEGQEPEEAAFVLTVSVQAAYKREQRGMERLKRMMDAGPALADRTRGRI